MRRAHFSLSVFLMLAWGFACVAAAPTHFTYSPTPFGEVLSHCMHEVPSGAHVTVEDGWTLVEPSDESAAYRIPPCETGNGAWPVWRVPSGSKPKAATSSSTTTSSTASGRRLQLPPDYDGWLQYTVLNTSALGLTGGFDQFTSVMSVPDVPKRKPHILYFFPGLQNRDWIPKVDPMPTLSTPFDILQPVLQFPGEGFLHSNQWALKSWYVTVKAGALFSTAIKGIQEGDAILCNMTRTGAQSWRVSGALRSDPSKVTTQEATAARLRLQPWAYSAVDECYGCQGCDTYPTKPIRFTDNKLYQAGKEVVVPAGAWQKNLKPATQQLCNESTEIAANGDATIFFA
jgi:hypothetical protein